MTVWQVVYLIINSLPAMSGVTTLDRGRVVEELSFTSLQPKPACYREHIQSGCLRKLFHIENMFELTTTQLLGPFISAHSVNIGIIVIHI